MAEKDDFDLYDALNLQRDASAEDVRAAFRELSRIYHPDKLNAGPAGGTTAAGAGGEGAFMRIHRAYRVLGDDVLRSFYDRYGLPGIRLAENLSDDEGGYGAEARQLNRREDRLKDLEARVRHVLQRNEELQVQRLLGLQGSFTLCAAAAPGPHGSHLRRRWRLYYSAVSHSVQITPCDQLRLTLGCATHVQGANGVGAAKLLLAASSSRLIPSTTTRVGVNFTGTSPEADVSLVRSLTPFCVVQQKASVSSDGCTLSLVAHPWLSRTLRGSLGFSLGEDPGVTLGLVNRSSSSGHNAQAQLNLQPGTGELSVQLKFKPSKDFSLKLAPALSPRGWTLQTTCTQASQDGLTKLQWAIRVRRRCLSLRLTLSRAGQRFSFPLELWPETNGPLPLTELGLGLVLWAAPPLGFRLLCCCWQAARGWLESRRRQRSRAKSGDEADTAEEMAGDEAAAVAAQEQRRLVAGEAARRRDEEVAVQGLEISSARYGDRSRVSEPGPTKPGVVDVTDCLMAKVRQSRLQISNAPKASLLGFHNPCQVSGTGPPVLHVRYRFGGAEYARTFRETEAVLLP